MQIYYWNSLTVKIYKTTFVFFLPVSCSALPSHSRHWNGEWCYPPFFNSKTQAKISFFPFLSRIHMDTVKRFCNYYILFGLLVLHVLHRVLFDVFWWVFYVFLCVLMSFYVFLCVLLCFNVFSCVFMCCTLCSRLTVKQAWKLKHRYLFFSFLSTICSITKKIFI